MWRRQQRADGPAAVLAIGTATPANCVPQDEFPDFYFRATKSEHLVGLKEKFKRVCQKLGVQKRYLHHTEELLDAHPEFLDNASPSLDARLGIVKAAVPELAAEASRKAIAEWGRPAADITHLVVTTNSGAHIPGVDFQLVQLLGLRPTVRRTMLYLNGCFAGAAALRVAKDLAENNRGARVLVVCAELTVLLFARPEEGCFQTLINQGLFGDGAGAVVVGADPVTTCGERPLFEVVSAAQTIIPESEDAIAMHLTKGGYGGNISARQVPVLIGDNIERCLLDAFEPLGVGAEWNDLFWNVHPGSSAILDQVDAVLQLKPEKLAASRRVLSEYGNMFGVTVIFVLDELRRRMEKRGEEGAPEWGVMVAFGPGLTVETMVLRRCPAQGTSTPDEEKLTAA
ncbi:Bisdemethoxycurcumin synthase [Dichanthelium oligosanthes]|uniref:Bisdemethoxycurcumin synthase n=1 Tax=Dichanthelium oligosanthes TaxID=888268 RepID=A0A1E5VYY9_9POAL|nr:Bisdemethoxycurcumin synthase [Dichanthelium oligosanthes]